MGRKPEVTRREFHRAAAQAPRFVEPAEPQTGATQRAVGPADIVHDSPRSVTVNELLGFLEPTLRLVRMAEFRQHPGGGGNRIGKRQGDVPGTNYRDPGLNP